MASTRRLVGVFVAIVGVVVLGTVALALLGGTGTADGENVRGQSPAQFQPENVDDSFAAEDGEISVDADAENARILVDTAHGNQVDESELEPVAEAMFEEGYTLEFGTETDGSSSSGVGRAGRSGGATSSFASSLDEYDGVLIVQPTEEFGANETAALEEYTDAGGRVVVLAEPTQIQGGGGLLSAPSPVSFAADNLTRQFDVRIGAEMLYNMDDENTDNNFKSVYASPSGDDALTEGVETVDFDRSGYAVVRNTRAVDVLYTANDGTRTLDTRREGEYPVVARNDNFVFVADSTFLERSDVYDVDNEVFAGNLLAFLASGDVDPGFDPDGGEPTTPRAPPDPPEEPTPPPGETPTPPDGTPTPPSETPPG